MRVTRFALPEAESSQQCQIGVDALAIRAVLPYSGCAG